MTAASSSGRPTLVLFKLVEKKLSVQIALVVNYASSKWTGRQAGGRSVGWLAGQFVRKRAAAAEQAGRRNSNKTHFASQADDCSVAITVGPTIAGAQYGSTHSILRHMSDNTLDMLAAGSRLGTSPEDAHAITSPVLVKKIRPSGHGDSLKAQDFQVPCRH